MQIVRRDPNKGYLDSSLWIPKNAVNVEALKRALTFELQDRKQVTTLQLWQETATHLLVPRSFWRYSERLFEIVDCRPQHFQPIEVQSRIKLDHRLDGDRLVPTGHDIQQRSLEALLQAQGGLLQLSCGSGKTTIALELITRLAVPAIIIVDNTTLMGQWVDEIARYLTVPGGVGLVEGGSFDWQRPIVLATFQTLAQRAHVLPERFRRWFGTTVWDESHHVGAPTFARTADMFYGRRYGLTATPHRADGMHVIYDMHIGPVVYKDLTQDLRPRIQFEWTGFELDATDQHVQLATHSSTGELHMGMLARYFGGYRPRLDYIVNRVRQLRDAGRKTLVLSSSIDELINLLSLWNGQDGLYSEIPLPCAKELDPTSDPSEWEWKDRVVRLNWKLTAEDNELYNQLVGAHYMWDVDRSRLKVLQHLKDVEREMLARQKRYLQELIQASLQSDAGLMIYDVKRDERRRAINDKPVTFSIMKYGREGLDSRALDTVMILEPQGQKEWIQQVMGRALRMYTGKKEPLIIFLEDQVGVLIGLCNKLRHHLRKWPVEEGGPYRFELTGQRPPRSWK
jgi:hypothetical protein